MPRFFLGNDFSIFVIAAGYATVAGGLGFRFAGYDPHVSIYMPLILVLAMAGTLILYRAFAAHFLSLSWKICVVGKDEHNWAADLQSLLGFRRISAGCLGLTLAMLNDYIMMLINGVAVFSWESLTPILVLAGAYHWRNARA